MTLLNHDEPLTQEQRTTILGLHTVDVDSVEAELNAYTRVQQVPLDTDPLMWWK